MSHPGTECEPPLGRRFHPKKNAKASRRDGEFPCSTRTRNEWSFPLALQRCNVERPRRNCRDAMNRVRVKSGFSSETTKRQTGWYHGSNSTLSSLSAKESGTRVFFYGLLKTVHK